MTFLLGTDVLIDHLNRREDATAVIASALRSGRRVTASVLTRVELRKRVRPEHAAALEALEALVEWIPVDHAIGAIAAEHAERFNGHDGRGPDTVGYVIAATAQRVDAELLTRHVEDFPMFPDLEPPY